MFGARDVRFPVIATIDMFEVVPVAIPRSLRSTTQER